MGDGEGTLRPDRAWEAVEGMSPERRERAALFCNLLLLLAELIVANSAFHSEGLRTLRFYTTDSNLFSGAVSLLYCFFSLRRLNQSGKGVLARALSGKGGRPGFPGWLLSLRYLASCCLMLTFFVVFFVLAPEKGYLYEFTEGTKSLSHLIAPLLSLFSLLLFERGGEIPRSMPLLALLLTLFYGLPILALNGIGLVDGPYSFLKIREQAPGKTLFWFIVILSGNFLIAAGIRRLLSVEVCHQADSERS
ncbi:hypothetical protein [Oribacterium sp. oral taxon 078]|uniref:hypothetical protein n=1 Tax=Oribacterium sp. oral taxon 078 TaxID=652706 RepID=UPI001F61D135|nr:hypothetical protein [Oribacterium sp. oral taxon 078]